MPHESPSAWSLPQTSSKFRPAGVPASQTKKRCTECTPEDRHIHNQKYYIMKVDFDIITELVRQVAQWVRDGAKQTLIPLGIRGAAEDGKEVFELCYDEKNIGLLVHALTTDEVLKNACFVAMVKILSDCTKEEREELAGMLARFGDEVDIVTAEGDAREIDGRAKVMYMRPSGIQS